MVRSSFPGNRGNRALPAGIRNLRFRIICVLCLLASGILLHSSPASAQDAILSTRFALPKQTTSLYAALDLISEKSGCLFIYDSEVVDGNKRVKLMPGTHSLKEILDELLPELGLSYRTLGDHVLIFRKQEPVSSSRKTAGDAVPDSLQSIVIRGCIYDRASGTPLPYASVGIAEKGIGTVANQDGCFVLRLPVTAVNPGLTVSHIGFSSQSIPVRLLDEQKVDIYLTRCVISLQEVIIRYIDPAEIVAKAMARRSDNNNSSPVYMTAFYREGVQKNNRLTNYSEAVFKIYKSAFSQDEHADQVKLLKSRKIQNEDPRDTVYLKLKAGVLSALQLDLVKCVPGFLESGDPTDYTYTYSDLVSWRSGEAYAVTFVQKPGIQDALYKGSLYIDKESFAILGAEFEVNPAFLDEAAGALVLRKSRNLNVKLKKIKYTVNYAPYGGKYYLDHARCDISLRTRQHHRLVSDDFSTFLEFVSCRIDTADVIRFPRQEILKPGMVFSDAPSSYDESFWESYNIVSPEAKLTDELRRIIGKLGAVSKP
jgi:hypothetical protein